MNNNFLKNALIAILFATPFVAFVLDTSLYFPYITAKNIAFRALIEIGFILYTILALRVPEYRPKLSSVFLVVCTFMGIIFVADIFGVFPFKSFWSNFERMEGFVTHLHLFVYFIMLSSVFVGEKMWTRFFQTSLAASVIMGLIAFDPEKMQAGRLFSNLGNSSYLGVYMLFNMFIAGFLLVRVIERKGEISAKWMKGIAYAFVILFDFYIFYNTGTRGALLGLVAGALITSLAFAIWEKNKGLKILGVTVLASIVLVVGLLATFKSSPFIQNNPLLTRFAALATFDKAEIEKFATTQGKSRFGIWGIAYEGFKERPILGWGQDNFNYVFNKYYDPKIYDQEQWFDRAHNVFFDWLIAAGFLGLLSYLALFVAAVVAIWRSKAYEKDLYFLFSDKVLLTALLVAYFIHNLFVFDSITSYMLFFGMLAFINIHDRKVIASKVFFAPIKNESYPLAGSVVAGILGVCGLYYFSISPYNVSRTLIYALQYQGAADSRKNPEDFYQQSLDAYNTVLAHDGIVGISESREQLIQSATGALSSSVASDDVKVDYFKLVKEQYEKQFETTPPDTRYQLFYGRFLTHVAGLASSTEMYEEGIKYLQKAVELSPRKQSALFELGAAYINDKEYKKAVEAFKKAFEGEENYADARFFYAVSLIYAGDNKTAEEVLKPLAGTALLGDYRLLKAYYDTKQLKKMEEIFRYKLSYADTLAASGDIEGATAQLNDVMELSPAFKAIAQKKLAELH